MKVDDEATREKKRQVISLLSRASYVLVLNSPRDSETVTLHINGQTNKLN